MSQSPDNKKSGHTARLKHASRLIE